MIDSEILDKISEFMFNKPLNLTGLQLISLMLSNTDFFLMNSVCSVSKCFHFDFKQTKKKLFALNNTHYNDINIY